MAIIIYHSNPILLRLIYSKPLLSHLPCEVFKILLAVFIEFHSDKSLNFSL